MKDKRDVGTTLKSGPPKGHTAPDTALKTAEKRSQLSFELAGLINVDRRKSRQQEFKATEGLGAVKPTGPLGFTKLSPAIPTVVYESYWRFAAERQEIFFRRLAREPYPWTADPILGVYKFTNAYRASDRVSQFLLRRVIYRDDLPSSPREQFFRTMLFKLFNKIETWQLLEESFGAITLESYTFHSYDAVLSKALGSGKRIYSAAYIMPPGGTAFGRPFKHQNHLMLLEEMLRQEVPDRLCNFRHMHEGFDLLRSFPTIGDFLAYQFITDLNYSELTDFSEREFVIPGPGARDGLKKCFANRGGLNEAELIRFMADTQEAEFDRLGISFKSLWGRPLQLIDCQNLFCEVDKYARVAHPEIEGISGRTRIKQQFRPNDRGITPFYPPKCGLKLPAGPTETIELTQQLLY